MFSNKKLKAFSRKADITVILVFYSNLPLFLLLLWFVGIKPGKTIHLWYGGTNCECIKCLLRNRKPGPGVRFRCFKWNNISVRVNYQIVNWQVWSVLIPYTNYSTECLSLWRAIIYRLFESIVMKIAILFIFQHQYTLCGTWATHTELIMTKIIRKQWSFVRWMEIHLSAVVSPYFCKCSHECISFHIIHIIIVDSWQRTTTGCFNGYKLLC